MLTDKEKADFAKGVQDAMANWNLRHGDPEKSFEALFLAQGHPPEKAARMAKIAKDGPDGRGL